MQNQAAAKTLARHYGSYAAATPGRRTDGWWRPSTDANADGAQSIERLRNMARDLRRNNGWARRAVEVLCNNVVGWGIRPRAIYDDLEPLPGEDLRTRLARLQRARERQPHVTRAMASWNAWADSTACDHDGRLTFYGLQRLAMSCIVESGEVLIRRHRVSSDDMAIPLRIQLLEPDYLATHLDGLDGRIAGSRIVQGVEIGPRGDRLAYHLYKDHPGSNRLLGGKSYEIERVDAEDIIHVYRIERPGQVRGRSWMAAAIAKFQDFDEWEDASLMRQKIAACFAAFIHSAEGPMGFGEEDDDPLAETLEPGVISYLRPGQQISFATPPSESGQDAFHKMQLHRISAAMGITYEDQSTDYSQVNFSSSRLARLSHWANVEDHQWNMLIPQLCDGVWRWAMQQLAVRGDFAESKKPRATWTPPRMPMTEPDKEGLAYKRLIRAGIMTQPEALREQGRDPDEWLAEQVEWMAKLDAARIWLDSDPRRTSDAGLTQERVGGGGGSAADTAKANAELSGSSDG
jgi:lambda family phage portal protein